MVAAELTYGGARNLSRREELDRSKPWRSVLPQ